MVESRTYCCDVLSGRVEGDVLSTTGGGGGRCRLCCGCGGGAGGE